MFNLKYRIEAIINEHKTEVKCAKLDFRYFEKEEWNTVESILKINHSNEEFEKFMKDVDKDIEHFNYESSTCTVWFSDGSWIILDLDPDSIYEGDMNFNYHRLPEIDSECL